jgi:HD-GYP domain-containing protein (c-di-GMP phosphodiesterase class II)
MTLPARLLLQAVRPTMADEIRSLGGVWIECDHRGAIVAAEEANPLAVRAHDLLTETFRTSGPFGQLLRMYVPSLLAAGPQAIAEPLNGLHLFVSVLPDDGDGRVGVAVFPTALFAFSDDLRRLAASVGCDPGMLSQVILSRDPIEPRELPRLASLTRFAHRSERDRRTEVRCSASVAKQLAGTFEELNLLYTLVAGSGVADEPSEFLWMACEELARTLGVGWVAARLRPPLDRFADPDGLLVAGDSTVERSTLLDLSTRLLVAQGAEASRIYPAGHPTLTLLGVAGPIVVCPIRHERKSNGVLLLGDLHGCACPDGARTDIGQVGAAEVKLAEAAAAHVGMHLENANLYRDLEAMFLGTLEAMVTAIDAKDPYTRGHSQRVALLSRSLARSIGFDETGLRTVHIAGLVHDIGKIGVPEAVLRKPGRLDDTEFAQVRQHPEIGWRILKDIPKFKEMLDGVLSHHERWDGRGYPQGLKGEEIPLIARIIALADSFDAMGSNRTYRSGRPREEVLAEIRTCAGRQFDPNLVGPFLALDFAEYDAMHAEHEASERQARESAREQTLRPTRVA